jgi:predicted SnoaL-like aldol condensation-catalyzing enzyme
MTAPASEKTNKAIVAEVMDAVFVKRKPASVLHLFSDQYVQHNPLIPNGKESIPQVILSLPAEFSYQPGQMVAEGAFVMIHGRYVGWGPKPMVAVDIFRLSEGLLVEHWDVLQEEVPADQSVNGNAMF